jgi:glutamate carboxypeptidase
VIVAEPQPALPDKIRDYAVSLLTELCTISSSSGEAEGLRRMCERLSVELSRRGLAVETVEEPDMTGAPQPVLLARGPAAKEGHLLLVGHMDTVLEAAPPHRDGDRLWATGALDMKGGLAAFLGALELLAVRGQKPPADLLLVVVPDEEVGGVISEHAIRRWAAPARAILVLEPGESRGDAETLVAGRRGLSEWRLEATGKAAHSGLAYWQGRSALAAAADWAAQAQRLSERGPGVTVNVARLVGGDSDFVNDLAHHHQLLGTPRRRNVIPDRALGEGEVRFLAPAEGVRILGRLEQLAGTVAAAHQVSMSFLRGATVPPVDPHGPGAALVQRTVELAAARGWRLEVEEDRGGISFPNYVPDPSRVPIVDGLGPVGDGMHTRQEYVSLLSLERRVVLLADLLASLA